jgi:NADPH:quinone reductase-like Zn-dependent oxidoreductase
MTSAPPTPSSTIAVRLLRDAGPEGLSVDEVEVGPPGPGEVLVAVHAAALTRDELTWPTDRLPAIPSYELSGVVVAVGEGVGPELVGAPVVALTPFDRDGVAAELATVPADVLARRPESLDDIHAAALPMPALTAWQALFDHGRLEAGQRVLVLGAGGGVGQLVVQLAVLHGATVLATASAGSRAVAEQLGAYEVLDPSSDQLEQLEPVDLVVDTAGGELVARAGARLRPGGRLVSIAAEPAPPVDSTVSTDYFVVEPQAEQLAAVLRLAAEGRLRVAVDSTFPLAQARAAFDRLEAPGKQGKVVLTVHDPEQPDPVVWRA